MLLPRPPTTDNRLLSPTSFLSARFFFGTERVWHAQKVLSTFERPADRVNILEQTNGVNRLQSPAMPHSNYSFSKLTHTLLAVLILLTHFSLSN